MHLLHQGQKPAAVTVGASDKWHQRWRTQGLEGLANQPKSGPLRKAAAAYWQRVGELLELDPSALGCPFTIWTAQRLVAHMAQETGVRLSVSRFRAVMKTQGDVYRRPQHDLKPLQDPAARAAAEVWLQALKKCPSRQLHPPLCGRNNLRSAAGATGLLDAVGGAETHSHTGSATVASLERCLQLCHGCNHGPARR